MFFLTTPRRGHRLNTEMGHNAIRDHLIKACEVFNFSTKLETSLITVNGCRPVFVLRPIRDNQLAVTSIKLKQKIKRVRFDATLTENLKVFRELGLGIQLQEMTFGTFLALAPPLFCF